MPIATQHGEGWLMVGDHALLVTCITGDPSDESFEAFLRALAHEIDTASDQPRGVVYEVPQLSRFGATRRQRVAKVLQDRQTKLAKITSGFALATQSSVVRGLLTAVFWLARPTYRWTIVADVDSAFAWIRSLTPDYDFSGVVDEYTRLRDAQMPDST